MATHYGEAPIESIGSAKDGPQAPPLLSEEELKQLREWSRNEYPRGRKITELIAEQTERTPDATALECEGWRLSYGELEGRSNQMGHWLRKQGVRVEDRVGVCMERSAELVVALLGVL
ncbi:MAG TPA: AMP-binding protein, partial [Candidatus Angelobacter sp.]|nr:AMP-binding protein [Candidatus Angelobacter sp.]